MSWGKRAAVSCGGFFQSSLDGHSNGMLRFGLQFFPILTSRFEKCLRELKMIQVNTLELIM